MSEDIENVKQKVNKFVEKVMKNENANLNLTVVEAQEVIWWWIYTEEFGNEEETEDAIENMRVEFKYEKTDDDDEKFLYQRIYNIKNIDNLDDNAWLPMPVDELISGF